MHSALFRWGAQPAYAAGWLAASVVAFTAKWWRGDVEAATGRHVSRA
jgi:hypothetical protein